jgi:curli production assembly/transport component CsgE
MLVGMSLLGIPMLQAGNLKGNNEIDGLIFNETRSPKGYAFQRQFALALDLPENAAGFYIRVKEINSARQGDMIQIYLNEQLIYKTFLGRRSQEKDFQEQVKNAVEAAQSAISNLSRNQAQEADLISDGF